MAQFIYTSAGRQRPVAVIGKTVSFKLSGAKACIYWTDRPSVFTKDTRKKPIQWLPLEGNEGIITGATFIQVRIEEITDQSVLRSATLEVLPAEGPENLTWGLLTQMNSNMRAMAQDLRLIASLV